MLILMMLIAAAAIVGAVHFLKKSGRLEVVVSEKDTQIARLNSETGTLKQNAVSMATEIDRLKLDISRLEQFRVIVDAEDKAREIIAAAQVELDAARLAAAETQNNASQNARNQIEQATARLAEARREADRIIAAATRRAEEIAGDAYKAMQNAVAYENTAKAMKNVIDGYGDQYIIPTYSLLDELAEEFGFTEAGAELKTARERTRHMVKVGQAATCDYVETNRKETAIRFIVDAFNGKVDSILSRSKATNIGTLQQAIKDAFSLVNNNGAAFRSARINQVFLDARLDELRWAVIVQELKEREKEEQRRIKEQIREEERALREFEKAIRDAEKEEEALRKAMDKIRKEVDRATEEQKAIYEAQLEALGERLREAEERGQRALSMAQQTRAGHIYIISNIGSFGEDVFKIGMTRRLEPRDRVRELGDASVPFLFDIHAMIYSDDAPTLEKTLHKFFLKAQLNKVNPRKEFFRVSLSEIRSEVDRMGVETYWTIAAAAKDYRESLAIERAMLTNPEIQSEWVEQQMIAADEIALSEAVDDEGVSTPV